MKFEHTKVMNFDGALRGMRNPKNSWDRSDTFITTCSVEESPYTQIGDTGFAEKITIGPNDLRLAQTLIKGGSEHRKFMRQIFVSVDITAPLYYWKELDTYKVGTVANSTSTMHKLTSQPITLGCFEIDDYNPSAVDWLTGNGVADIINFCEQLRQKYVETKDKRYWKELVRWLPESWLQTRTVTLNYENLYAMFHQREHHKLNEWSGTDHPENTNFIDWVKSLPYSKELIYDIN